MRNSGVDGADRSAKALARPLRVLIACDHVAYDGQLHGSGRFLIELLRVLAARGISVHACVLRDPGGLARHLADQGLPIKVLDAARFSPRPVLAFATEVRAVGADVLHAWDFGASTWSRIAALFLRIPVVIHVHSHHSVHQRRGFPGYVRVVYRALASATTRAVVISGSVRDFAADAMGFTDRQIVVVGNPVARDAVRPVSAQEIDALRDRYGLSGDGPVVGTVTRLFAVKGVEYLLAAFALVLRQVPAARLLIVGDGPLRSSLEAQARALGIAKRTVFAGHQSDVAPCYRLFAVTAVPSLEEGLGMVAIESIVAGTPVVASSEGGLREVVHEGRSGLLVPAGDAALLAVALTRVLSEPALAASLRIGCAEEAERFVPERFAEAMEAVYRDAVAAGSARNNRSPVSAETDPPTTPGVGRPQ